MPLTLDDAITRFKENEERMKLFVNDIVGYDTDTTVSVESIQAFLERTKNLITATNNKILNGSFELDSNADAVPDNWTLTYNNGNVIFVNPGFSFHGSNSLRFVVGNAGLSTLESDFFPVQEGLTEPFSFAMICDSAVANVQVNIKWHSITNVLISTASLYANAATNPLVWTDLSFSSTPPAGARFATIEFDISAVVPTVVSFDNVRALGSTGGGGDLSAADNAIITGEWEFSNNVTKFGDAPANAPWTVSSSVLEVGDHGYFQHRTFDLNIGANAYYDGSWRYIDGTLGASRLKLPGSGGDLTLDMASTGSAGDVITWVPKFNIPRSGTFRWLDGNFLLSPDGDEVTPNHSLVINGAVGEDSAIQLTNAATGNAAVDGFVIGFTALESFVKNQENTDLVFYTNNLARGRVDADGGLVIGTPTGDSQGVGTINAVAVYDDGVVLTDYVFDFYVDGKIEDSDIKKATTLIEKPEILQIDAFSNYWKKTKSLPTMPSRKEFEKNKMSVGQLAQKLWETVEIQAIHINELNQRIKNLESK